MRVRLLSIMTLALVCGVSVTGQSQMKDKDNRSGYDKSARATVIHDALLYGAADDTSEKAGEITPGHEVVIVSRSGPWLQVFANTDTPDDEDPDANVDLVQRDIVTPPTGWIKDKGVITPGLPGGDSVLFGMAANMEAEAEEPHPPKGAADAAKLLYRRVFQYFPDSKLAADAAWRAADIRWQLEKRDMSTLPSAKEQEAYLRPQLYEGDLKRVMKLYPRTRFEALAAWDLIDNKLCGDWQGLPKCPEMETSLYMRYTNQYPESPRAAEAEFEAVYRQGVLVTMYQTDNDDKRAQYAAKTTQQLADDMEKRFGIANDFAARAASVAYRVKQGISVYGSDRE
jgi:hypothetical protein